MNIHKAGRGELFPCNVTAFCDVVTTKTVHYLCMFINGRSVHGKMCMYYIQYKLVSIQCKAIIF